jgi:hypothetical protein
MNASIDEIVIDETGRSLHVATLAGVYDFTVSPTSFHTAEPCRVIDTRVAGSLGGPALAAGTSRTMTLAGSCGISATASSVALNITVTEPTASGYLTLHEAGSEIPETISIAYRAGQTRANNAIVALDPLGRLTVKCNQPSGSVHVILDVSGYFE